MNLNSRPLRASAVGPWSSLSGVSSGLKPQWLRGCGPGCSGFGGPQCCLSLAFLVQPLTSRTCCGRASDRTTLVALVTLRACAPFCPRATVLPRETLSPSRPGPGPPVPQTHGAPQLHAHPTALRCPSSAHPRP